MALPYIYIYIHYIVMLDVAMVAIKWHAPPKLSKFARICSTCGPASTGEVSHAIAMGFATMERTRAEQLGT